MMFFSHKSICILTILFLQFFYISNCFVFPYQKKKNNFVEYLILIQLLKPESDSYAKLFYMNPLILNDLTNLSYLNEDFRLSQTDKKKIVLIHGWNLNDPSNPGYPSQKKLKERVTSQWDHILKTDQTFIRSVLLKNYEIYFFTYLTSTSIEKNGKLLRNRLDKLFSSQKSNVIIFAHSMGGLVSRTALYQGESPSYLQQIISSGTPYHGSPWASEKFQNDSSVLGDIANFITSTEGGNNLGWDNFDLSLPGATNSLLTKYNSNTSRDYYIKAYYGSLDSNGSSYTGSDISLLVGCRSFGVLFSPSDCIVPQSSASFVGGQTQSLDLGNFHHIDMNLRVPAITNQVLLDLP
jgi:hypothetical protein